MGAPTQVDTLLNNQLPQFENNNNNNNNNNDGPPPVSKAELEATYTSLIQQYLQVMCLDNATFLAERMVASCKTTNALYLLAVCHYRNHAPQRAICVLEDVKEPDAASLYLLAKCCLDLEHYGRAEEALLQQARVEYKNYKALSPTMSVPTMDEWLMETSPCPIPNGAAGFYVLGNICRRSNRKQRASVYYKMSLQLDPLMWTSYEALCELGDVDIDPTSVFGVRPTELDQVHQHLHKPQNMPLQEKNVLQSSFFSHAQRSPMEAVRKLQPMDLGTPSSTGSSIPKTTLFQTATKRSTSKGTTLQFDTPNLTPIPMQSQDASFAVNPPDSSSFVDSTNPSTIRRAQNVAARLYYQLSPETPDSAQQAPSSRYLRGMDRSNSLLFGDVEGTPLRRGGRQDKTDIHHQPSTARKPRALFMMSENKNINNPEEDDQPDHADPKVQQQQQQQQQQEDEKPSTTSNVHPEETEDGVESQQAVQEILENLCMMGAAFWRLCQYRCREALQLFNLLPHAQHNTGWVLHQEGRAYFEMADYQNAQRCLELMQRAEPHRMKGLELLSTVLWQLKKEVELSHLAQRVVDFDRLSPEAWCVVGNCFSLQKEHETALVFFGRSLQLNPSFTYTHTLSGYEYMANEDFDKAVACFRNAIRADERHYNAWYGLGAIYHRQEKYDLAEYHFHRGVAINPQSSVLRCNLGMSQYSNGKPFQALDTLAEAFRLDPQNPQARFQRATIYVALNRPEDALKELEKVRDAAPREATIHFAMGKVLKRLGRPEQAMRCFLTALDLDPKDNQLIKSAMDKLDEPDVDEEVVAF